MLFRKKRGMIDVGELAKQGKITPLGSKTLESDANKEGFVELGNSTSTSAPTTASNTMNFFDTQTPSTVPNNSGLVDRITALSQKISKMDQRLEVIEKKLGIGDSAPPVMW
jgi:hypothetical protein